MKDAILNVVGAFFAGLIMLFYLAIWGVAIILALMMGSCILKTILG